MNKKVLREKLKDLRSQISQERRLAASETLLAHLLPQLFSYKHILSFVSFGHEIDMSLLNSRLAHEGRLLLPRIHGHNLQIFQITDIETQLFPNSFSLFEPGPAVCKEVSPSLIQCILIPALGFDAQNHRIGYGKGFYDRFLKQIPHIQTIGIGFKEQYITSIPVESTDISLQKVSLF